MVTVVVDPIHMKSLKSLTCIKQVNLFVLCFPLWFGPTANHSAAFGPTANHSAAFPGHVTWFRPTANHSAAFPGHVTSSPGCALAPPTLWRHQYGESLRILSFENFHFMDFRISNISFKKLSSFYYIFPFPHPISDFIWYHPSVSENRISIFVLIFFTSGMFFLLCCLIWRGGPLICNRFQNILVKIIWRNV